MKTENTQLKPAGPRIASTSAGLLIGLNTYRTTVLAFFLAGATLLSTSAASAATITVINTNDSGPGSLRQALVDANNGDTINFDSSLNGQRITLTSGQLNVDKDVSISGPGAKNLAVDGNRQSRVFYINPDKTVTIDGLTVANGYSDFYGGGIYNDHATLTVSNCIVSDNSAYSGGGIRNEDAALTLSNSTISGNLAGDGGGISNLGYQGSATMTVTNCTLSGNLATFDPGGGIDNAAVVGGATATLTITNSTISGNSATPPGGGIANVGSGIATLTITNSTISGNSSSNGGGIFNAALGGGATLTITNSTISGNSADNPNPGIGGGGILNDAFEGGATVTITNSTLSGNSASDGGGISSLAGSAFSSGDSIVAVSNCTISSNSATGNGGGIFNDAYAGLAAVETKDTIFDAGSSGENIFNIAGTVISLGYNVSSDNGGGYLTGPGDQINTDPVLGPLQDNGGPTFTHSLLPHSPAIDTGDPSFTPPPFYDQRGPGFDRVVNGRIDVGSFEIQSAPTPTPTPRPSPTPRHRPTPMPR
jgi:hypothetical protein